MTPIALRLSELPFLRAVQPEALAASLRYWSLTSPPPGVPYRQRGAPALELAVVLEGELEASSDGVELGRVGPGELVGEVAAFLSGGRCSATLVPTGPTTLLALRVPSLLGLRRAQSPLYDALLEHALRTLCRRVRDTDARFDHQIALLPRGLELGDTPTNPGPTEEPPPLEEVLDRVPGAAGLDAAARAELAQILRPQAARPGEHLIEQDSTGDRAFVLAEGRVRVFRRGADGRERTLTLLGPGDPFGVNALIDGGPRTATCEALTDAWLYTLDTADLARLSPHTRRALGEVWLSTLAAEQRVANALVHAPALSEADARLFRAMLSVSGVPDEAQPVAPVAAQDPLRGTLA